MIVNARRINIMMMTKIAKKVSQDDGDHVRIHQETDGTMVLDEKEDIQSRGLLIYRGNRSAIATNRHQTQK